MNFRVRFISLNLVRRRLQHVRHAALDLAKITGAVCTTKVPRQGVQSCEEGLKAWAPEAAE